MNWLRVVGSVFVVIGAVGFLTIADDLRHVGELLGVGSVSLLGLLLLVAGSTKSNFRRAAILLAGAVGIGAVAGVAADNVPAGAVGGLIIGAAIAVVVGRRGNQVAE